MTTALNDRRTEIEASAGQTTFTYTFDIIDSGSLVVTHISDATGDETTLAEEFTGTPATGKYFVTAGFPTVKTIVVLGEDISEDDYIVIEGDTDAKRIADYPDGGDYFAAIVNTEQDNQTNMLQELVTRQSRSVSLSPGFTSSFDMSLPHTLPIGHAIIIDSAGTGLSTFDVTDIATNTSGIATNVTDIATNTSGIATNVTAIASNTAHKTTDGASHTFINQNVTTTGTPEFASLTTGNIVLTGTSTVDGRDVSVDGTKLDTIDANATADQTGAEIKTAYEGETNAFTDAQFTKLANIEAFAKADQSIESAYHTGADAIIDMQANVGSIILKQGTGLQATSMTDNVFEGHTSGGATKWSINNQGDLSVLSISVTGTVDGVDIATRDGELTTAQTKLAGIETSATADQTSIVGITGTTAQFNSALSDGSFVTGGGTVSGSNTGDEVVATSAEVTTGTDTTKYISPDALKDSSPTFATVTTTGDVTVDSKITVGKFTSAGVLEITSSNTASSTITMGHTSDLTDGQIAYSNTTDAMVFTASGQQVLKLEGATVTSNVDFDVTGDIEVTGSVDGVNIAEEEARLANTSGTNTGDEVTATTSTGGVVELATDAEVISGTADKIMTAETFQDAPPVGNPISNYAGTATTLALAHAGLTVVTTSGSAVAITIPANASVAFKIGTEVFFMQKGAGAITVGITSDTLRIQGDLTAESNGIYSVIGIKKIASTEWLIFGNLVAS